MEVIYAVASFATPPLVSGGCVLVLFLWARRLGRMTRVTIAGLAGPVLTAGPGIIYNALEVGDSDPSFIAIYFVIFLVISVPFSWLLTRTLERTFSASNGVFD